MPSDLSLDDFVQFLVDHAHEVVGYSGLSFFRNPLAEWLAASCGRLAAVDSDGYVFLSSHRRYPLPRWGRLLVSSLERYTSMPLTGEMVFQALSQIEADLQPQCF